MSTEAYEILMAVFPNETGAGEAVATLDDMAKDGVIEIIDAAILVRDASGEVSVKQHSLPSVKRGTAAGAIIGGVIGLIFPPSLLGAAAIGAGIGAGSAKLAKMALKSDDLWDAAKNLEPGTSAYVAVIDQKWVSQMSKAMEGYSSLAEHTLDASSAAELGVVTDEATGDTAASMRAFATDEATGAPVAAAYDATVDGATGAVVESGVAATMDPETGEIEAAGFAAAGVLPDETGGTAALDTGDDPDAAGDDAGETKGDDAT
jgi:uncharacterized membrane protein